MSVVGEGTFKVFRIEAGNSLKLLPSTVAKREAQAFICHAWLVDYDAWESLVSWAPRRWCTWRKCREEAGTRGGYKEERSGRKRGLRNMKESVKGGASLSLHSFSCCYEAGQGAQARCA